MSYVHIVILLWNILVLGSANESAVFARCSIVQDGSTFQITSHPVRTKVKHGEALTFAFKVNMNQSLTGLDNVNFQINGSNLEIVDMIGGKLVWQKPTGQEEKMLNSIAGEQDSSGHMVGHIEIAAKSQHSSTTLLSFSGRMHMKVMDSAPTGGLLRPCLFVFLQGGHIDFLLAEYVFIGLPQMRIGDAVPGHIDMKETTTVQSKVLFPRGPMEPSLLQVYMPMNLTAQKKDSPYREEPFLSVTDFQLTPTAGLTIEPSCEISFSYESNTRTSESEAVKMTLPMMALNDPRTPGEVGFSVEAYLLDFAGLKQNSAVEIGYAYMVGEVFVIVNHSTVIPVLQQTTEKLPKLRSSVELVNTFNIDHEKTLSFEARLVHEHISWGSAYSITWSLYLPPYLGQFSVGKSLDFIKSGKWLWTRREGNVIEFEIRRISFLHNIRVQFNVTVEGLVPNLGEHFTLVSETIYNSWRKQRDFSQMEGHGFMMEKLEEEQQELCACSPDGQILTSDDKCITRGKFMSAVCVDCKTPWKCVKTLKEYGSVSTLQAGNYTEYRCGHAERNRKEGEINACISIADNTTVTEMAPRLGALLGFRQTTGTVYGISRNGLAYVSSADQGVTWNTVIPDLYQDASIADDYISAATYNSDTEI